MLVLINYEIKIYKNNDLSLYVSVKYLILRWKYLIYLPIELLMRIIMNESKTMAYEYLVL